MKTGFFLCLILGTAVLGYEYDPNDFAVEVIEYVPGLGIPTDQFTSLLYDDPNTAIGRPAVDTIGDGYAAPPGRAVPVVPVYPAWRPSEVVSIGLGGHLILKFGHPVSDDINNPYGKDLIVFGNSFQQINGSDDWLLGDPLLTNTKNKNCTRETGIISVSQNGQTWFTYDLDPNSPDTYSYLGGFFADQFSPTLGRVYDPADPSYWTEPTDPTLPLDPAVIQQNFRNTSLADICLLYGNSAGGTALDISGFDLPRDPVTGRKWIQYIRIENFRREGSTTPEIDAVADVSCCGDWKGPCIEGDIDQDGTVDLVDLIRLSQNWLICGWNCSD